MSAVGQLAFWVLLVVFLLKLGDLVDWVQLNLWWWRERVKLRRQRATLKLLRGGR